MTVASHFTGKDPAVLATYRRILDSAKLLGPVTEDPKKTSIHLEKPEQVDKQLASWLRAAYDLSS